MLNYIFWTGSCGQTSWKNSNHKTLPSKHSSWWRRVEDVFKTSWRCLQWTFFFLFSKTSCKHVLKTSWRRFKDVLKTSCEEVLKTSWRRLEDLFGRCPGNTSWRRLEDVLEDEKLLHWRSLQDVLEHKKCLLVSWLFLCSKIVFDCNSFIYQ